METQSHNNQGIFEQLQLNTCSAQNTGATQTVSEQPDYSQTGNIFQTLLAQPRLSSHTESTIQSVSQITQIGHALVKVTKFWRMNLMEIPDFLHVTNS